MKTIWKYTLDLANGVEHSLDIPEGGSFLFLKDQPYVMQEDLDLGIMPKIDLWFAVDSSKQKETRTFQLVGTGNPVPGNGLYRGTCFPMRDLVLHVWEIMSSRFLQSL